MTMERVLEEFLHLLRADAELSSTAKRLEQAGCYDLKDDITILRVRVAEQLSMRQPAAYEAMQQCALHHHLPGPLPDELQRRTSLRRQSQRREVCRK